MQGDPFIQMGAEAWIQRQPVEKQPLARVTAFDTIGNVGTFCDNEVTRLEQSGLGDDQTQYKITLFKNLAKTFRETADNIK